MKKILFSLLIALSAFSASAQTSIIVRTPVRRVVVARPVAVRRVVVARPVSRVVVVRPAVTVVRTAVVPARRRMVVYR